jgi:hypothetical protein
MTNSCTLFTFSPVSPVTASSAWAGLGQHGPCRLLSALCPCQLGDRVRLLSLSLSPEPKPDPDPNRYESS